MALLQPGLAALRARQAGPTLADATQLLEPVPTPTAAKLIDWHNSHFLVEVAARPETAEPASEPSVDNQYEHFPIYHAHRLR